jgi:hypothetical protein
MQYEVRIKANLLVVDQGYLNLKIKDFSVINFGVKIHKS